MKRTNFAFRYQWSLAIAHLPAEYRLEIFEATVRYAETGATGPMSDVAAEAFGSFILPDFERRRKAADYRARAKARKAQAHGPETEQPMPEAPAVAEPAEKTEEGIIAQTPTGPNRRERRRHQAEEKRLQKKRRRNAAARAGHEAEADDEPTADILPRPRVYTPYWL